MSVKQDDQTKWVSCSALTLYVEWQEEYLDKNPVVVPINLSFVTALAHPGYPGSNGCYSLAFLKMQLT